MIAARGAAMILASTLVPSFNNSFWVSSNVRTISQLLEASCWRSRRCRNRNIVDSSGTASSPNLTGAKLRIDSLSYSTSSDLGSDRSNHCCRKYTRSMVFNGNGRRPRAGLLP